jgi:alpha-tubulin suppressor-like RCC1 family protein
MAMRFIVKTTPTPPPPASGYKLFAIGGITSDGDLGQGSSPLQESSPVQVGSESDWEKLTASRHVLGVRSDGTLWTWGRNADGQLGQEDLVYRSSPVQIGSDTDWDMAECGSQHSVCIKTDGTMWSFGAGSQGRLGHGDLTALSSPVQIGALTDWEFVSSQIHNLAVKTDGTLWSWGRNYAGELGIGVTGGGELRSSPVQIGALTDWETTGAGSSYSLAKKTDGTLWAWGVNNYGQLAQGTSGTSTSRSSPVQIGSDTDWDIIASGVNHIGAIKTDGTLWMWGYNDSGQLGQNQPYSSLNAASSPVQVGSDTDWAYVTCGSGFTLAVKTNGTLWAWGTNSGGALGQGDTAKRSSPVQIGALTNWEVGASTGEYTSFIFAT